MREQRRKEKELQEIKEIFKSQQLKSEIINFSIGLLNVFKNAGLLKESDLGSFAISEPLEPIEAEYTVL